MDTPESLERKETIIDVFFLFLEWFFDRFVLTHYSTIETDHGIALSYISTSY